MGPTGPDARVGEPLSGESAARPQPRSRFPDRPRRRRLITTLTAAAAVAGISPAGATRVDAQVPADTAVRRLLAQRFDAGRGVAVVVGIIDAGGGQRIVAAQKSGVREPAPDAFTVFEIGSITKVFTATALAEMADRGEVRLADPVARYLPAGVRVPSRNGREITLEHLAAHTSGLPRLPANLRIRDMSDPYADYTVEQIHDFLNGHELARDPGERSEYSNFGAGLLGHALALRAGTDYEALVRARILEPLAMSSTAVTMSADMQARLAPGHNAEGRVVANWHLPSLAGAGALRSTVHDMLKFLAASLRPDTTTSLGRALVETQRERATVADNLTIGLGWHVLRRNARTIVWHNGGTGGYRSFIGFDPQRNVGVVILSNTNITVDDLGVALLGADPPQR